MCIFGPLNSWYSVLFFFRKTFVSLLKKEPTLVEYLIDKQPSLEPLAPIYTEPTTDEVICLGSPTNDSVTHSTKKDPVIHHSKKDSVVHPKDCLTNSAKKDLATRPANHSSSGGQSTPSKYGLKLKRNLVTPTKDDSIACKGLLAALDSVSDAPVRTPTKTSKLLQYFSPKK